MGTPRDRNGDSVLVLGGDGLLGSHLVRQLLERGYAVRVFVQPGSTSPTLDGLPLATIEGDLLGPPDRLAEAIRGCRFAFHCAAITDLWADADTVRRVNVEGTARVLDACVAECVQRLIYVGTASSYQFGDLEQPGDETGPFPALYRGIPYMETKYEAWQRVCRAVDERGLDAVGIAPTFLLGDLDWRPSSGELIRQFLDRGMRITSPGGRNFAFAPDVARAMVAAMDRGKTGECYLAGGHNLTYWEFFERVARLADVRPPQWVAPAPVLLAAGAAASAMARVRRRRGAFDLTLARISLAGTYYSSARARQELQMPTTPVDDAIASSIRSLREYGHIH